MVVAVVLILGIGTLFKGGKTSKKYSNKIYDFIDQEDFDAHEVRVCINERRTLDDSRRPHNYTEQQYLKTAAEMNELFSDIPEALENAGEIVKRCNLSLELDRK